MIIMPNFSKRMLKQMFIFYKYYQYYKKIINIFHNISKIIINIVFSIF